MIDHRAHRYQLEQLFHPTDVIDMIVGDDQVIDAVKPRRAGRDGILLRHRSIALS